MSTFNALNGQELIEVIKDEIGKKLHLTGEFKPHSTWPWVRVSYEVKILGYPQQDVKDEPKIKISNTIEMGQPTEETPTTIADLKDVKVIDTPDLARVEAKLPIPVPVPAPGNVHVDRFIPMSKGKK